MPSHISWRKFVQKLRTFGFEGPFGGGRHLFMVRGALKLHIPNPHRGDISKYLVVEILHHAGISHDECDAI